MAEETRKRRSDSSLSSSSSGSFEARRRRVSGAFDVAGAHRALELLGENSLYGSIVISDGLTDVCFFFTRGGLRVVATGRKIPSLAERLRAKGAIGIGEQRKVEAALQAHRDKDDAKSKVVFEEREALIEVAKLRPQDVDEVAREVIAEVLLDCLFWDAPQFEAATGEPNQEIMQRRDLSAVTLSLGVADLVEKLQVKIRAVSEVRRTVSSLRVAVEPTPKGREAADKREKLGDGPVGERRTRLMQIVAKQAGIRAPELCKQLQCGELELASLLQELTVQGYLRLDRPPQDKKEELERLRKMEEAVDQALSHLLRRVRMAEEAANVGDGVKAARHMARAGGLLLKDGRDDEAARTFSSALKHSQEDLEAREGFVQSLWATGRATEALDQSEELGRRYLALNLPARAKKILERALGREERTGTLDLLVTTLVRLRLPKQATEAGERLVNRLRREGKREEARQAAARLLAIADPEDRARLLRAAGVDRRRAVVLVVTLVGILGLSTPVAAAKAAREEYARAANEAREALTRKQPLEGMPALLAQQATVFEQLAAKGGEPGELAGKVQGRLSGLRDDLGACLAQLRGEGLAWREAGDLETVRARIQEVRKSVKTEPVRGLLDRILVAIETFRSEAETTLAKLAAMQPGPQTVAEARRLLEVYRGLPELLRETQLRIQVGSLPPGARVKWDGIGYSQTTPLSLALPLVGHRQLSLELEGYLPAEKGVELATLPESGIVEVTLEAATPPPTRDPISPPTRDPTPPPPPVRPPERPPVEQNPPPPPPPVAASSRIEVRDEVVGGAGLVFESSAGYFAGLNVPTIFRTVVVAINEVDAQNRVRLTAVRVHLVIKTRLGWTMQKEGVLHRLDEPYERTVQARDGKRVVLRLDSPHLFVPDELKEEAQEALDEAVKDYRYRRGGR